MWIVYILPASGYGCMQLSGRLLHLERKSYKIIPRMPGGPRILKKLFWFWTTFAAVPMRPDADLVTAGRYDQTMTASRTTLWHARCSIEAHLST